MRIVAAAAAVAALVVFVFVGRYLWVVRYESRWAAMQPQVAELQDLQKNIHDFRDWFDDSAPSLAIATRLTGAFPEDGAVWATTVGIKGLSKVLVWRGTRAASGTG